MGRYYVVEGISIPFCRYITRIFPEYQRNVPSSSDAGLTLFDAQEQFVGAVNRAGLGGFRKNPFYDGKFLDAVHAYVNSPLVRQEDILHPKNQICVRGNYGTYRLWQVIGWGLVLKGDVGRAIPPTPESRALLQEEIAASRQAYADFYNDKVVPRLEVVTPVTCTLSDFEGVKGTWIGD